MSRKKIVLSIFTFLIISSFFQAHSQVLNDAQLLKPGNWIYESMQDLSTENRKSIFLDTQPISVGELKFYLSKINYESLSESGKSLYSKVEKYLYTSNTIIFPKDSASKFSANLISTPEYYIRTNKTVPSTMKIFYKNYSLEIPIKFGFAENLAFQLNLFFGKDRDGYLSPTSFTNIPFSEQEFAYEYPRFAYGNIGKFFSNWGFSATLGKEGFSIGNTKLGSIIYNSSFETDSYSVFSAYSENIKYNLIISQVDAERFVYLHNFNMKLFSNLKFSITEGGLHAGPFQLRYLTPTMILHSFYSVSDFNSKQYSNISGYSSYLGASVEYVPVKNLRLYLLYAQNELQLQSELESSYGKTIPDSFGFQVGFDYIIPHKNENFLKINLESIYNTPFLYLKPSPEISLIKYEGAFSENANSVNYIGSPLGSDVFAVNFSLDYKKSRKWTVGFSNLLTIKGEINEETIFITHNDTPAYYPSIIYKLGLVSAENAISFARSKKLTGTLQYRNDTSISYEYFFSEKLEIATEVVYTFIINHKNVQGDFKQGFEFKFAISHKFF